MLTLLLGRSVVGLFVVSCYLLPPSTGWLWLLFLASLRTSGWDEVSLESCFDFRVLNCSCWCSYGATLRFLLKQVYQSNLSSYDGISDWADFIRAVFHYQIASRALPHLIIQVCLERVIYIMVHSNSFILCYANACTKYCFLLSPTNRPLSKEVGNLLSSISATSWSKSVPLYWLA